MEQGLTPAVAVVADALSVVVLLAAVAVLLVTAQERESRRLLVSCMAFLYSLQAVTLAFGFLAPLRSYLGRPARDGEAAWWSEFEQGFARHVARGRRRRGGRRTAPANEVERSRS